jgi:sugar phosphate isomerase/epimerase
VSSVKLGVMTVLYQDLPLEEALDRVAAMGVQAVELGTGNYPGNHHCNPDDLLDAPESAQELRRQIEKRRLMISALSAHGNPLHPDEDVASAAHDTWRKTVRLASLLEVPVVIGFSGCPGDHPGASKPNWVTCAWPTEFLEVLEWQWSERVTPYWVEEAAFAQQHGVRVALEMHPGFVVYNPETLLRLRGAAGPAIGANFDPSHLFWQGIDAVEAIRALGREKAIFHVHAKDTYIDPANARVNGVLDTKDYGRIAERSWVFRTVGYGQNDKVWRDIMSALRTVDYDYVMSIEHEDALLSIDEGLKKAVDFLNGLLFKEDRAAMWWA